MLFARKASSKHPSSTFQPVRFRHIRQLANGAHLQRASPGGNPKRSFGAAAMVAVFARGAPATSGGPVAMGGRQWGGVSGEAQTFATPSEGIIAALRAASLLGVCGWPNRNRCSDLLPAIWKLRPEGQRLRRRLTTTDGLRFCCRGCPIGDL